VSEVDYIVIAVIDDFLKLGNVFWCFILHVYKYPVKVCAIWHFEFGISQNLQLKHWYFSLPWLHFFSNPRKKKL